MEKRILINARHPEEKRVAIVKDKELRDFYVEVPSAGHLRGNIYKAVITAVDRGLQAAFVDFGPGKHGFLPLREVMPENYKSKTKKKNPDIKEVLEKGQELVVQVEQDERGQKGAKLTNRISLPGRYLVMIPGNERLGISRKIEEKEARERLREAFKGLRVPKSMGFILRTAGEHCSTEELAADLKYLTKLWNKIKREEKKAAAPSLLYTEEAIAVRTVRDYLTPNVAEVLVDDAQAHKGIKNFLKLTMPWQSVNLKLYTQKEPLFDNFDVEEQIGRLSERKVSLPSGGTIVIDRTEALTAIDVNSGKGKDKDIESLALKTNLDAATEIARQLRLRDIGGLIVIDFIDMKSNKNYQKVEEAIRAALNRDKAHYDITRISKFGILEMSRERMREGYFDASSRACPCCRGLGTVKSPERLALAALRKIHTQAASKGARKLTCRIPVDSANYMMNQLRPRLAEVEAEFSLNLTVVADPALEGDEVQIEVEESVAVPKKEGKKSRRGRGRRKKKTVQERAAEPSEPLEAAHDEPAPEPATAGAEMETDKPKAPKKRRPRRRRRSPKKKVETE